MFKNIFQFFSHHSDDFTRLHKKSCSVNIPKLLFLFAFLDAKHLSRPLFEHYQFVFYLLSIAMMSETCRKNKPQENKATLVGFSTSILVSKIL